MNTRKALFVVILAALITIGIAAWILWDVVYLDVKPLIIAVCVMFVIAGVIIVLGYPRILDFYDKKVKEDKYERRSRIRNAYIVLFVFVVIIVALTVYFTMEEKYDISYSVDDEVSEYTLYGQTYAEYKVSIDIETFDISSQPEFNKRIQYLYKQVIKDDGFDRHVVYIYEEITDETYTVAMVTDGHEWKTGWLITPNEEFYNELFDENE